MDTIMVTGAAGFIGFHVARRLLDRGDRVVGVDNATPHYDVSLKEARLAHLEAHAAFELHRDDVADRASMEALFDRVRPDRVVHLAAQAGVRHSLKHPYGYVDTNMVGFIHVLEGCRRHGAEHLLYASSSSVYGRGARLPFSPHDPADHPMSIYAASKRANELMAHTYSHLHALPTTGLRLFTVYGPWGRPDMALFLFTDAILHGRPVPVFNRGDMARDFTYVDDVVEGVVRVLDRPPDPGPPPAPDEAPDPATSDAPFRIYNIGNSQPVNLLRMIEILEDCLGREAIKEYLPRQPGDALVTHADIGDLARDVGYRPGTPLEVGVQRFVSWYRSYYGV
ncbi:MAG: SDR family NAD(P)-dependent oxidoreductase [Myxococcota bacterium]